jgi:molybdenum cofactor synthesis domain-containing protein
LIDNHSKKSRFRVAILITSDRAHDGIRPDKTGPALQEYISDLGYTVLSVKVVPDDKETIVGALKQWIGDDAVHLILVSGGTGLSPRDVTPEATLEVIERRIPGMEEAMRHESFKTHPHAVLSRGVVGCAGQSLIINLPGSPRGAVENLAAIEPALVHALELIGGESPDP